MTLALLHSALGLKSDEAPFQWQQRLFKELSAGQLPSALDLPTGLGKTSVMALWLVALATGAKLPRRLIYLVDRRVVVDQATTVAVALREVVAANETLAKGLGLGARALPISTLRGQFVDNKEWLDDPAAPAIVIGTIDMIGSRLLFGGYGVSPKMRSFHAGILGADTLFVLDEAHLVPPFEKLLAAITEGQATFGPTRASAYRPPRLLSLSATGRTSHGTPFTLRDTEIDPEVEGVVAQRLGAEKRLALHDLSGDAKLHEHLAASARALIERHGACRLIVFCNTRDNAQKTADLLNKPKRGEVTLEVELLVGARRVHERTVAAQRLEERGFIAGSKARPTTPTVLVATSAGEVGIDLDADHMVCDLVAWERMIQRLGRVNRRGNGKAEVEVLVAPPAKESEDDRTPQFRAAVEALPMTADGRHDASPGAMRLLKLASAKDPELARTLAAATSSPPLYPALVRPIIEAWAMTSLSEHGGRPDIGPWLRGWVKNEPPQTTLVWRRHLPTRPDGARVAKDEVEAFFEAAPPHTSELLETETFRALEWLLARVEATAPGAGAPSDGDTVAFVLGAANELVDRWTLAQLRELETNKRRKEDVEKRLVEGVFLVVDARLGGLTSGLLVTEEDSVATCGDDGSDEPWSELMRVRVRVGLAAPEESVEAVEGAVESGEIVDVDDGWQERYRFVVERDAKGDKRWLSVEAWRDDAATANARSISPNPQSLDEHARWTEERARLIGMGVGLAPEQLAALALAARLHDEGKAASRWQEAFRAPKGERPFAKTRGPINQKLLDGYRHELGSYLEAIKDERVWQLTPELRDLVLHLIVSHHGFARPVIGLRGVDDVPPSRLGEHARDIAERFARLQLQWGPWGLAWWESLMRSADQQASRANDALKKQVK